jgi:hypothetical protein
MIAQAMRAILLATATATSLAGFLASNFMIQGCFCGCWRALSARSQRLLPVSSHETRDFVRGSVARIVAELESGAAPWVKPRAATPDRTHRATL